MKQLIGVRHKGEAWFARKHPRYNDVLTECQCDRIEPVPRPDGAHVWLRIITELPSKQLTVLRIRVEECDQFFYLEDV